MHILCWTVTHVRFLTRIICHTKRFSDSREKRDAYLERNEKRPEINETRLARNETLGGNLLLSGTVIFVDAY